MMNALAQDAALQSLAQHIGREDVGNFFEKIAGVLFTFDANAKLTQAIDPAPHRRARDADLAGNPRTTDDNRRVFGEEIQQRSDAAVGRSWKRLLGGALGHEKREV